MKVPIFLVTIPLLIQTLLAEPTFNADIAPLIHKNCTSCHRPGEAAPFSLITYDDVRKKARTMQRVMNDRYMPPWHAADADVKYAHNRRLADGEIALFNAWMEAGRPEGMGSMPEPPAFPEGWQLGEPDLVLTMKEGYPVPAEGPDIYRNFVLPLDLPGDKWVKAIELRPSARQVVHHSLYFVDTSGTARERDGKDGKPGFSGMAGVRRAGSLGGYVPGATPKPLPEDLALPLPQGADLILATHFHPSGKAEMEQSAVGIYFADEPPSRSVVNIQVPPAFGRGAGIDVPPGEKNYTITDSFDLPIDVEATQVGGHAHYICREMKMTAALPDGTEKTLLHIDDWDLNWQDNYRFANPVSLPAGTTISSELIYDNSEDNPDNPFDPPRRIKWGRESTDEMGSITLMVTPKNESELAKLNQANRRKQVQVLGAALRDVRGTVLLILEKRIKELDSDGNGKIEKAEIPPRYRARVLPKFDIDSDDALDRDEVEDLLEAIRNQNVDSGA